MSGTRLGIKTGQGLDRKIVAYFAANPDEELSIEDIKAKWGASTQSAYHAVTNIRKYGIGRVVVIRRLPLP